MPLAPASWLLKAIDPELFGGIASPRGGEENRFKPQSGVPNRRPTYEFGISGVLSGLRGIPEARWRMVNPDANLVEKMKASPIKNL
jgi:hypothetical protein